MDGLMVLAQRKAYDTSRLLSLFCGAAVQTRMVEGEIEIECLWHKKPDGIHAFLVFYLI